METLASNAHSHKSMFVYLALDRLTDLWNATEVELADLLTDGGEAE